MKTYVFFALPVPVILQGYCSAENMSELMAKMEAMERRQVAMEKHVVAMETQHKEEIRELSELSSKTTALETLLEGVLKTKLAHFQTSFQRTQGYLQNMRHVK